MEDFEIDIISDNTSNSTPIQLPLNFLNIGEIENDDVKVYIHQDVYKEMEKYASSDTAHELGTIMIGEYSEDMGKMHVVISDFIYAKYTDASASTLTFTHETWDYVHKEHDEKYPDKKIVGWQHTHPGYGIFLSNYDMFIQENFFNLPFQVAYVIDPVQHLRGFFQWKNGKVEKLKGFYIYDDVGKNIKIDVPKKINKDNDEKQADVIAIGKSQRIIQIGMAAVMLGLIIFSLSISRKYTNQVEKQRELEREIAYQNQMLSDQASEIDSIKISMNDKQEETAPSTEELLESTIEETTSVEDGKLDDTENATESATQESSTEEENGGVYFKSYIVEPGDSLLAICNKQGIDYSSTYRIILSLNGIEDANAIYVGQTILLPIEK